LLAGLLAGWLAGWLACWLGATSSNLVRVFSYCLPHAHLQKKWPLYGRDSSDHRLDWDRFKAWILMEGLVVEGISDVALSRRQHKTRLSDKTTFLVRTVLVPLTSQ
jgi:hypothetical protein